jgi:hypothetical protein
MQTILSILKLAGGWHHGLNLKIENPPYLALVIEATDESGPCGLPAISVAYYGERNGDMMRRPEMLFELGRGSNRTFFLDPFYWRNDFVGTDQHSRSIADGHYVVSAEVYERHIRFAEEWDNVLRTQDLVSAFVSRRDSR